MLFRLVRMASPRSGMMATRPGFTGGNTCGHFAHVGSVENLIWTAGELPPNSFYGFGVAVNIFVASGDGITVAVFVGGFVGVFVGVVVGVDEGINVGVTLRCW